MGATFFLAILIMGAMLLCAAGLVVVSVILLLVRSHKKRQGGPLKRRYNVLSIVCLVLAVLCVLPTVCTVSYIRSTTADFDNHIGYGETVVAAEDGSFHLEETTYYTVKNCSLMDTAELGEPIANYFDSFGGSPLMRIYFTVMGVHGDPVYPVENAFGFDLLSTGNTLLCSEGDFDALTALCSSYKEWGSFCLTGRHLAIPETAVSLSPEVFGQMVQWRDGEHTPDTASVYGDAVTLSAISSDGALSCPLVDFLLTEGGEWMVQYIIWNGHEQGQFSTETLPEQWTAELLPILEQMAEHM